MKSSLAPGSGAPSQRAGLTHWPGLDGLRGVAAIAVVLFHAGFGPAVNGYAGVDVFFALSGFLITSLLLREHARSGSIALGRFYIRRLLRLYPALLATCLLVMLIAAATHRLDREVGPAAAALLYVANWWVYLGKPAPLLDHTWTLAIEEHFYALWPAALALLLGRSRGRRIAGGLFVAVVCLLIALPWPDSIDGVRGSYLRGVPIVWGSLLAIVLRHLELPQRVGRASLWTGSVLLLLLLLTPTKLADGVVTGPGGLAGWLSVLAVAAIVSSPGGFGGVWGSAPLVWIGRRSYGLYLYHFPILSLFAHQVDGGPPWLRRLVALPVVLVVTAVSYRFLESPFLALKDRLREPRSGGRRRARPGATRSGSAGVADAQCYRRSRGAPPSADDTRRGVSPTGRRRGWRNR